MSAVNKPIGLILAGGLSRRLFPIEVPKPLMEVRGASLIEMTLDRLRDFDAHIVTSREIGDQIKDYLQKKGRDMPAFIYEPEPRDTAPAIGYALSQLKGQEEKGLFILSADQYMPDDRSFIDFLAKVEREIESHPKSLFVAGSPASTKPVESHSQFGWIAADKTAGGDSLSVKEFIEKPDGVALDAIRKAGGLINCGMFFGKVETFVKAFQQYFPEALKGDASFASLPKGPVDRVIFEKFDSVRVIAFEISWHDLGTWEDWFHQVGEGQARRLNTQDCLVDAESETEVYAFDLHDIAIIQRNNKILVMPLSKTRQLKAYLEELN